MDSNTKQSEITRRACLVLAQVFRHQASIPTEQNTAACVETSFLDMGRAGFQDSYSRLRGHHRPEPTRAEGAQQPAEVISQDVQAHLGADGL